MMFRHTVQFGKAFLLAAGIATPLLGQEPSPAGFPRGPFAVGSVTKTGLPEVDCWGCHGPRPCVPCDGHHSGYLYYGAAAGIDLEVRPPAAKIAVGFTKARVHWQTFHPFRLHSSCEDCD